MLIIWTERLGYFQTFSFVAKFIHYTKWRYTVERTREKVFVDRQTNLDWLDVQHSIGFVFNTTNQHKGTFLASPPWEWTLQLLNLFSKFPHVLNRSKKVLTAIICYIMVHKNESLLYVFYTVLYNLVPVLSSN